MNRGIILVLLLFVTVVSKAIDSFSLDLGKVVGKDWQLDGVSIIVGGLNDKFLTFVLSIDRLALPKPYDYVTLVNIQCSSFVIESKLVRCNKGVAEIKSPWLQPAKMPFSLQISDEKSYLTINNIAIAGGIVSLTANQHNNQWKFNLSARHLQGKQLGKLVKLDEISSTGGSINFQAEGQGGKTGLQHVTLHVALNDITAQTADLKYAGETLSGQINVLAKRKQGSWQWENKMVFHQGAVYVDPVFIQVDEKVQQFLTINMAGNWEELQNRLSLHTVSYLHPGIGSLNGQGLLYDSAKGLFENASISIQTENLDAFANVFLNPFFAASQMEDVMFAGKVRADINFTSQSITDLRAVFSQLAVTDPASRFNISEAAGQINWTRGMDNDNQSFVSWNQLNIYGLSVGRSDLSFNTDGSSISLNQPGTLPFYGGIIKIDRFAWEVGADQEPDIHFQGSIDQVSLEQLTTAMDWTPLSGIVSGEIPGVTYQQGKVKLDGELKINVFEGEILIKRLVSSALFSEFPIMEGEVEIFNLDLKQLTKKFSFGYIEGKLSGYIHNLYLENWQPITFYAWLGTPDDDNSRHRISQKAVQNIADIGGGGAADLLSRSFLRFFETFRYNKLGIGCYLHKGICQLMGVKATEQGYYIVEGGGLPRIDVIGYNPRVDWDVLLNRLERITSTDNVVVE